MYISALSKSVIPIEQACLNAKSVFPYSDFLELHLGYSVFFVNFFQYEAFSLAWLLGGFGSSGGWKVSSGSNGMSKLDKLYYRRG
jgi:hypothetical protein